MSFDLLDKNLLRITDDKNAYFLTFLYNEDNVLNFKLILPKRNVYCLVRWQSVTP